MWVSNIVTWLMFIDAHPKLPRLQLPFLFLLGQTTSITPSTFHLHVKLLLQLKGILELLSRSRNACHSSIHRIELTALECSSNAQRPIQSTRSLCSNYTVEEECALARSNIGSAVNCWVLLLKILVKTRLYYVPVATCASFCLKFQVFCTGVRR